MSGPWRESGQWCGGRPSIRRSVRCSTGNPRSVASSSSGMPVSARPRLVTRSLSCPVHWVAGTESARSIPLGVFAQFVGSATAPDPVAFLAAARETLLAQGQCVIAVDDAHLLDQLSATLLHQLALDGSARI